MTVAGTVGDLEPICLMSPPSDSDTLLLKTGRRHTRSGRGPGDIPYSHLPETYASGQAQGVVRSVADGKLTGYTRHGLNQ